MNDAIEKLIKILVMIALLWLPIYIIYYFIYNIYKCLVYIKLKLIIKLFN
jgi:hypothetical protein